MNCEEFEIIGFGLDRSVAKRSDVETAKRAAAIEHAQACPHCAALQQAWLQVQGDLQVLRAATQEAQAPPRVEMRLLQEFRNRKNVKPRTAVIAAWAFAAAAVLAIAVSWWTWRAARQNGNKLIAHSSVSGTNSGANAKPNNSAAGEPTLIADNDGDFTLLPGSFPQETDDAAILRVRLQRGALGALGLPVNEERASEWLQVDLLVGEDGQPRAVRLPSATTP